MREVRLLMYDTLAQILGISEETKRPFWEVVREEDCNETGLTPEESGRELLRMYRVMKESDAAYDPALRSESGMVGGEGAKLAAYLEEAGADALLGSFSGTVCRRALQMAASNACMRRIVAAPTAGSCGVLPAVLISMEERYGYAEEDIVKALYTAGAIGGVIAARASLSGAAGGCQAEVGSAAAMAAGAAVQLRGGSGEQILHAAAIALKNLLGLACDPVAGLVEVPCVKRNVIGAMDALSAADMALAGITSVIPADEVIDAMGRIGRELPENIRETGEGGLAATPTGVAMRDRLNG